MNKVALINLSIETDEIERARHFIKRAWQKYFGFNSPHLICEIKEHLETGENAIEHFYNLPSHERPEAIIVGNHNLSLKVYDSLKKYHDWSPMMIYTLEQNLSHFNTLTLVPNYYASGKAARNAIEPLLHNPDSQKTSILLPLQIFFGNKLLNPEGGENNA